MNSSPDICISLKALPENTTINQVQELTKQINSLFNSEVITLKCINGAKSLDLIDSDSNAPTYAEELINVLKKV